MFCAELGLYLFPLQSLHLFYNLAKCFLLFFLIYFISAAAILLASLAVMVQFSLSCDKAGRTSVMFNFILVLFKDSYGLNIQLIVPVILK